MSKWPMVPLGKVLQQDATPTPVYADQEYPNFGIYSFGRGLFTKPPISGATTSAKTLYRVKAGQFIYSRLFAFEGAYGLVGEEFDGCYISNEYPHFDCDPKRLSAKYLAVYLRWPKAWERAAALSTGMGDRRRRIQPEQLLKMQIPLPPLSEQQKIVEWIDAVAARVEEAKELRNDANNEFSALNDSITSAVLGDFSWPDDSMEILVGKANLKNGKSIKTTPLSTEVSCLTLSAMRDGNIDATDSKPIPMSLRDAAPYKIAKDDVFVVRGNGSKHLVGRAGVVTDVEGTVIFPDLFIQVPLQDSPLDPEFFVIVWNSRKVRDQIEDMAKTTSGIWKVNQSHIADVMIPAPSRDEQREFVDKVNALRNRLLRQKSNIDDATSQLSALIPSVLNKVFNGDGNG